MMKKILVACAFIALCAEVGYVTLTKVIPVSTQADVSVMDASVGDVLTSTQTVDASIIDAQ